MTDADFAAAHDEAYGTRDGALREVYGPLPRRAGRQPAALVPATSKRYRVPGAPAPYRVTSDARILCNCGVYVYTESIDGRPPVLPASCWRCLSPLVGLL